MVHKQRMAAAPVQQRSCKSRSPRADWSVRLQLCSGRGHNGRYVGFRYIYALLTFVNQRPPLASRMPSSPNEFGKPAAGQDPSNPKPPGMSMRDYIRSLPIKPEGAVNYEWTEATGRMIKQQCALRDAGYRGEAPPTEKTSPEVAADFDRRTGEREQQWQAEKDAAFKQPPKSFLKPDHPKLAHLASSACFNRPAKPDLPPTSLPTGVYDLWRKHLFPNAEPQAEGLRLPYSFDPKGTKPQTSIWAKIGGDNRLQLELLAGDGTKKVSGRDGATIQFRSADDISTASVPGNAC